MRAMVITIGIWCARLWFLGILWFLGMVCVGMPMAAAQTRDMSGQNQSVPSVHILGWQDFPDGRVLDTFTRETGIGVVYDVYDSPQAMERRLQDTTPPYDIVITPSTSLGRLIAAKRLMMLDPARLTLKTGLMPEILKAARFQDAANAHAIPYQWGMVGFIVDSTKIREKLGDAGAANLASWAAFLKPDTLKRVSECGINLLDSPDDVFPGVMKSLGIPAESRRAEDLHRASAALLRARPAIRSVHETHHINALAKGEICVATGSFADYLQAKQRAKSPQLAQSLAFIVPKEGASLWFDALAIPAHARNVAGAHAFLNFLLRPEVAARVTMATFNPSSITQSSAFLAPGVDASLALFKEQSQIQRLLTFPASDGALYPIVQKEWARIRAGK